MARAHAKINLYLRVGERRADTYHDIHTVFQSLALHDTLRVVERPGPFAIVCRADRVPTDRTNLVWRAASLLWQKMERPGEPRNVGVHLTKRIPVQAGLGGGSSDGVAALRALAKLWRVTLTPETLVALASSLGADAPYFVTGGTALGVGRGDQLYPLVDLPSYAVLLATPSFGVSTREAYAWLDEARRGEGPSIGDDRRSRDAQSPQPTAQSLQTRWPGGSIRVTNDFEAPVSRRHPPIGELVDALKGAGALAAAMTGSGASIFGIFPDSRRARRAAPIVAASNCSLVVTEILPRTSYARSVKPSHVRI